MTGCHKDVEGVEWKHMDVRDMGAIADKSIDVAFDKGTLDSMIYGSPWNPPGEVKENSSKYMKEVGLLPLAVCFPTVIRNIFLTDRHD